MAKRDFVRNGGRILPPGFRFQPTDEEIVFQYLARKTFCRQLPAAIIPEIDILSIDPCELTGNSDQDWYFFSNTASNSSGVRRRIKATCSGFWKFTGLQKPIIHSTSMPVVGIKKTFVFHQGKNCRATRTDWFMQVYHIALNRGGTNSSKKQFQGSLVQVGKWVLCHLFLKKTCPRLAQGLNHGRQSECDPSMASKTSDVDSSSSSTSSTSSSCSSTDSDSGVVSEVSSYMAKGDTCKRNSKCS